MDMLSTTLFILLWSTSVYSAAIKQDDVYTLRIIHTNDMHARFEQTSKTYGKCSDVDAADNKCYGGYARVYTAAKQQRTKAAEEGTPILFLNAGDTYQGTIWYTVYKWEVAAYFTDLLGLDAMSLGNHEFDDGVPGLVPFLNNVTTPVITCNLDLSKEPTLAATPLKNSIIKVVNGTRIGIIGYLTPETKILSNIGNVIFKDEIQTITEEVKKMKADGVQIIIAVGHSAFDVDLRIAKAVPDLDVIVGGHSHTFLYTGENPDSEIPASLYPTIVTQDNGRRVAVVQAFAYTKYFGILNVDFDANGEVIDAFGDPLLLNHQVVQDPGILLELDKWREGISNATQQKIGKTKVFLDGDCRFQECNLGNLIADASQYYVAKNYASKGWTMAPIALLNGGSIRASINVSDSQGTLVQEDIITTLPFYNSVEIVQLEGQYLLEALEWSVARYDPNHIIGRGEFLQMSGVRVTYVISNPVGSRVVKAEALCQACDIPRYEAINPGSNYTLSLPSFISNGGDNYTMFKDHKIVVATADLADTDQVIEYIQERSVVYPAVDGRITFQTVKTSSYSSAAKFHPSYSLLIMFLFYVIK